MVMIIVISQTASCVTSKPTHSLPPFPSSPIASHLHPRLHPLQDTLPLGIRAPKPSTTSSTASASTSTSPDSSKSQINPVDRCTVTFTVSPHTGLVTVSEKKGMLLSDRREAFWFWVQVSLCVLFLILLVASPFLYGYYQERSVTAEHILWLKKFYLQHAPEVRHDMTYLHC